MTTQLWSCFYPAVLLLFLPSTPFSKPPSNILLLEPPCTAHAPFMPSTNIQLPPSSVSWGKCLGFLSRKRTVYGRTKGAENGLLWRRKSLPGTPNPSVNLRQPANAPLQPAAFPCMGATQLSPGCCCSYNESPANRTCALATNTAFLRARRLVLVLRRLPPSTRFHIAACPHSIGRCYRSHRGTLIKVWLTFYGAFIFF